MLKLSDGRLLFVVNLKPTDKQEVGSSCLGFGTPVSYCWIDTCIFAYAYKCIFIHECMVSYICCTVSVHLRTHVVTRFLHQVVLSKSSFELLSDLCVNFLDEV